MVSIFLAKLIGIYMVLVGLIFIVKRRAMIPAMKDLIRNPSLIYIVAILELIAGIALVLSHNIWAYSYEVIITLVGWAMVVEGVVYMLLPYKQVRRFVMMFNTSAWYIGGGLVAVLLGAYLAAVGFNLI